jgi:hypothetical protein
MVWCLIKRRDKFVLTLTYVLRSDISFAKETELLHDVGLLYKATSCVEAGWPLLSIWLGYKLQGKRSLLPKVLFSGAQVDRQLN